METEEIYKKRLTDIVNFTQVIIIAGNGYDVKQIILKIAFGQYTYKDAIRAWHRLDWDFVEPYEIIIDRA